MPITVSQCHIKGLYEIQPKVFGDDRGYFFECYSERDFAEAGISSHFVQDNQSVSKKGVLRGLHFQKHHPQGKLVRVVQGSVYDVALDLRNGSATFGKWHGLVLDSERQNQLYIPPGFAHGFFVLSDVAVFAYKCTDFYYPDDEDGIMWNDPVVGVPWETVGPSIHPVLSAKDSARPLFNPNGRYFDAAGIWHG